ncbi:MAG TPA: hypothetical protein VGG69_07405 [Rhizomicrobium sp.]
MVWNIIEFLTGLAFAGATLADVFSSILVPGRASSPLRVITRLRQLSLPAWRFLSRWRDGRRQRLSNSFAPLLFSFAFIGWLALLCLGFALMLHACASFFTPPLRGLGQALYVAGAYLLTVGTNEVQPHGFVRVLLLFGALSGFGVITATITFILEIQSNLHERETGVLKLNGLTGNPPSGIGLLETLASLNLKRDLTGFFKDWAHWSASVMNSHVSFPVLVYFHSVGSESDWVTALQLMLDAATLVMELTEEESAGAAAYMHRAGSRTAAHLCDLFHQQSEFSEELDEQVLAALVERLKSAGYDVRAPDSDRLRRFIDLRSDYAGRLNALAKHLGSGHCPLLPQSA